MKRLPRIPLAQLVDPENTPHENHHNRSTDKRREDLELFVQACARNLPGPDIASVPESVLDAEGDESEQDGDLQREACQPEVDACGGGAVGCGGEGAADGLDHEADEVEGDEELVVEGGFELGA